MQKLFRTIDTNVNRAYEGLRVLEDMTRFDYNSKSVSEGLRILKDKIRNSIMEHLSDCLLQRDSVNDIIFSASQEHGADRKKSALQLLEENFKRVQEALKSIEETLKVVNRYELSKVYEGYRFTAYNLEKEFYGLYFRTFKKEKLDTDLYCLTAEEYSLGRSNIEVVKAMLSAGIKIIQYREKEKKMLHKYNECVKIRELTYDAGTTFVVNDDLDLAMMVGADGVHIGQDDLPLEKVRELVGEEMIIGVSTHSPQQAQDAISKGADYIGVGPIFSTGTKKDVCDPVGFEYLDYAVKNVNIPFVAIGGIKEHNITEIKARGVKMIAMVTEIVGAENIEKKIERIRKKLSSVDTGSV